jgi:outer membrane protein OmpA-like peptidoglycan-associated protein
MHLRARKPFGRVASAIALTFMLGACSSVPDWANPVAWYEGSSDWVDGEDEGAAARAEARKPSKPAVDGDKSFPTLSTVPERPKDLTKERGRRKVESSLVADRNRARYEALAPGSNPPPQVAQPAPTAPSAAQQAVQATPGAPAPAKIAPVPGGSNQAFQQAIAQQGGVASPRPTFNQGNLASLPPAGRAPIGGFGRSLQVGTVLFSNGSSRIRKKYYKILRDIVRLQRQRGGKLRIIGHASSRTRNTNPLRHQLANFRISVARAKSVARRLVRYGARAQAIEVTGVADNKPVYQEIMPSGEAGNRRAEIYLDY